MSSSDRHINIVEDFINLSKAVTEFRSQQLQIQIF